MAWTRASAAANVLIALVATSSRRWRSALVTPQLEQQKLYWRQRDPKQSTAFSFTAQLMGFQGWAIFMDCDMLCRADISESDEPLP